MADEFMAEFPQ
jgi:hypothetical protein